MSPTSDDVRRSEVPEEFRSGKPGASLPQLTWIRDLVNQRDLNDSERTAALKRIETQQGNDDYVNGGISKNDASLWIDALLKRPRRAKKAKADVPGPEAVPAGRYAILVGEEGVDQNDWHFYHVKRGTRNPDYVWVHRMSSDDEHELSFPQAIKVLRKIVESGASEAAAEYGRRFKRCSRCNRGLTRRISRKLNVGPVCGGHWYQDWDERVTAAREELRAEGFDPDENIEEE